MNNNPLRLAGGTEAPGATIYNSGTENRRATGIVDENGNHIFRYGPAAGNGQSGGPPSGGYDIETATLKTRINGAFTWLGLLTVAGGAAFLLLLARIDAVNQNVAQVQSGLAGQTATIQAVKEGLDRMDRKSEERGKGEQELPKMSGQ